MLLPAWRGVSCGLMLRGCPDAPLPSPRVLQAARVLSYPSHGLAYLLDHFCGFKVQCALMAAMHSLRWRAVPVAAAAALGSKAA